ncbi:MAG TPA: acetolactate synthase large subunit [Gammaproteobacteria bacterium]|nr:acetolactate synthase large subunit [Gammaproteobacteria bacterium]
MENGSENIIKALEKEGVEVCFTNPGTSELHLVEALGQSENIKSVLCLFEGVVTGAADGYARMSGKPAATLLHLGPGFANGIANMHNAQKANSPMVNLVGQHALTHLEHETPLHSDIMGLAKPVSGWVETIFSNNDIFPCMTEAIANTKKPYNRISTVIIPADIAWSKSKEIPVGSSAYVPDSIDKDIVNIVADILLKAKHPVIFVNTTGLDKACIDLIGKIQKKIGCRIFSELFVSRLTKGAGEVVVERIPFRQKEALKVFENVDEAILVGAHHPRTFFAYPGQSSSSMFMPDCRVTCLVGVDRFSYDVIKALVTELGADDLMPDLSPAKTLKCADGELTTEKVGQSIAALLPESAIISDDGITSTFNYWPLFVHAPRHDWLYTTGGAIGQGLPVAVGAAIAEPQRPVICLSGDGSAMYTIQSLWTQVRENLNIVNIIYSNRSYKILNTELTLIGIDDIGETGKQMLDLSKPNLNFVDMASSMGMSAICVSNMEAFNNAMKQAIQSDRPNLIEVLC